MAVPEKWLWLKIKELGLRGFLSLVPFAKCHFGTGFLSHSEMVDASSPPSISNPTNRVS